MLISNLKLSYTGVLLFLLLLKFENMDSFCIAASTQEHRVHTKGQTLNICTPDNNKNILFIHSQELQDKNMYTLKKKTEMHH